MKISFVAPQLLPCLTNDFSSGFIGGAERQQALLAKGLVGLGHQVSAIVEEPENNNFELPKNVNVV
ncbi:hypothetical protein KQH27_00460, partial [bacterium]|nr:hypothetical protein [bacterium]